ncbi:replication-associated recombination protein A [Persicobacter sp. CCB-QB2]|uniref:replication-associated recombination protein A n=1 Tax=Persicobacter sp. CCB-QB2 TaxID=1561025 RepID=UPI0006A94F02|nr:replication-associated recombination protein A [Persicobacter sp. CCB-QB2]
MIGNKQQPLAERLRPRNIDEMVGQQHLVGPKGVLRHSLESGMVPSLILWGPPGVGKTTLAQIMAETVKMPFATLSAISSGVKDVREVIDKARRQEKTLLFIDEIHRFNKGQQDALLGAVERGHITLIGATTENPSFEVNGALLSRCQVYTLKSLEEEDLKGLVRRALSEDKVIAPKNLKVAEYEALLSVSGGDARKLLNLVEIVADALKEGEQITNELVKKLAQQRMALYDKNADQHYDLASAMIKSIRGSDPNAAVYWMSRMIKGGEDIKFIARRLLISASEDVGMANPTALVIATNAFQAVQAIGYPEGRIILAQCAAYLASSPKSNASYMAVNKAMRLIDATGDLPVPLHLRNAPTKFMKEQGYGKGYNYSHDNPGNFAPQEYLPEGLEGTKLYDPGDNQKEKHTREWLKYWWKDKYGY